LPPPKTSKERERDPFLGRVLDGRFTLLSRIGRGGMGLVYRAQQATLGRGVALKVLVGTGEEDREAEFQRRFFREAATAAKLKHPNTITVFDYGSDMIDEERVFYIAMELLEGQTLSRACGKSGLGAPRAVHVALQIARSLREAHAAGIVHRDLKPGNVMLISQEESDEVESDFVKVLDFGLAKTFAGGAEPGLTRAGTFLGSPRYVAPEQVEGRAVDPRTDIYSFGCVLYRMLTGKVPFDGDAPVDIMMQHLEKEPRPITDPEVPDALAALCLQCLEKQAKDRPQSMQEVIAVLKRVRMQLTPGLRDELTSPHSDPGDGTNPFMEPSEAFTAPPADMSDPDGDPTAGAVADDDLDATTAERRRPGFAKKDVESWVGQTRLDDTRPTGRTIRRQSRAPALLFLFVITAMLVATGWAGRSLGWFDELPLPAFLQGVLFSDAKRAAPGSEREGVGSDVTISLESVPAGARVIERLSDGRTVERGHTPLELSWDLEAQPESRRFILRKDGFRDGETRVAKPAPGDDTNVRVRIPLLRKFD
jgi:serine/threonine-protein kinase